MNKVKTSKLIASAVLIALTSVSAHASQNDKKELSKQEKTGMVAGATTGALIAGPFGAAIGFIAGTLIGSGAHEVHSAKQTAKSLDQQLASAKADLAEATASNNTLIANQKASMDAAVAAAVEPLVQQLAKSLQTEVLFRTASAELEATAAERLANIGAVLGAYPGLAIEIDGFADPRGKSTANDELSEQRAMAVRAALIEGGAASDRIRITAHGNKLSKAVKDDLEAYAWERRVSLSVVTVSGPPSGQVAQVH